MILFSVLSDANKRKISQLLIHQKQQRSRDEREEVVIPDKLCTVEGIRTISLRGNILTIPSWIFKEKTLEMLALSGHFESLPETLGELKELNTLDLSVCTNLVSLPSSIGNLSHLTSLNLKDCINLDRIPYITPNPTPSSHHLWLNGCIQIPSNIEWDHFTEGIGLIGYLRYMVQMKRYSSFVYGLSLYLGNFFRREYRIDKKRTEEIVEICRREEDRGAGVIKALCRLLSRRMIENSEGSVDLDQKTLTGNEIRDCGVGCLSLLYYLKELVKNQGEDEIEEHEWKGRWREILDVMGEEDVVETLTMMLCIPAEKRNVEVFGLWDEKINIGSDSSMLAVFGLGEGIVDGCHFDLREEDNKDDKDEEEDDDDDKEEEEEYDDEDDDEDGDEDERSVVIRNLPVGFVADYGPDQLQYMMSLLYVSVRKTRQPRMKISVGVLGVLTVPLAAVKFIAKNKEEAIRLVKAMNEVDFCGRNLIVKRIRKMN